MTDDRRPIPCFPHKVGLLNTLIATDTIHRCYLVRIGSMGNIGRFLSDEGLSLQRTASVLCRSARGLEHGTVLAESPLPQRFLELLCSGEQLGGGDEHELATAERSPVQTAAELVDGRLLRMFTPEDHLLWQQLSRFGAEAHDECRGWLEDQGIASMLLDVEPLMDGKTLIFHFLSAAPAEAQTYLDQLVQIYERRVRKSKFAQLLDEGCGPGCGTSAKSGGCGTSGGCAVCSIAKQCKTT